MNFNGLTGTEGVTLNLIDIFEEKNPNISVTVYGNNRAQILPIRSTQNKRETHVSLLLVEDGAKSHYIGNWDSGTRKVTRKARKTITLLLSPMPAACFE